MTKGVQATRPKFFPRNGFKTRSLWRGINIDRHFSLVTTTSNLCEQWSAWRTTCHSTQPTEETFNDPLSIWQIFQQPWRSHFGLSMNVRKLASSVRQSAQRVWLLLRKENTMRLTSLFGALWEKKTSSVEPTVNLMRPVLHGVEP